MRNSTSILREVRVVIRIGAALVRENLQDQFSSDQISAIFHTSPQRSNGCVGMIHVQDAYLDLSRGTRK